MKEPEPSNVRPKWPPYTDVGLEWDKEAWAYIRNLEKDIQHLKGEVGNLREHLRRADKIIEAKERYIEELRK